MQYQYIVLVPLFVYSAYTCVCVYIYIYIYIHGGQRHGRVGDLA